MKLAAEKKGEAPLKKIEKGFQVKDTESSNTPTSSATRLKLSSIQLCNVYYSVSELMQEVAGKERGPSDAPYVLIVDAVGGVHALLPDDPRYASSLGAPGFICTMDASTTQEQLASSLRDALMRLGAQESA